MMKPIRTGILLWGAITIGAGRKRNGNRYKTVPRGALTPGPMLAPIGERVARGKPLQMLIETPVCRAAPCQAEAEGFEPPEDLRPLRFSRPVQ